MVKIRTGRVRPLLPHATGFGPRQVGGARAHRAGARPARQQREHDGPHLHFGIQDGPHALTSNSLPFEIDRYRLEGTAAGADAQRGHGDRHAARRAAVASARHLGQRLLALSSRLLALRLHDVTPADRVPYNRLSPRRANDLEAPLAFRVTAPRPPPSPRSHTCILQNARWCNCVSARWVVGGAAAAEARRGRLARDASGAEARPVSSREFRRTRGDERGVSGRDWTKRALAPYPGGAIEPTWSKAPKWNPILISSNWSYERRRGAARYAEPRSRAAGATRSTARTAAARRLANRSERRAGSIPNGRPAPSAGLAWPAGATARSTARPRAGPRPGVRLTRSPAQEITPGRLT